MRKEIITLVCAIGLLGTTTGAFAGAYGESVQAEEAPAAAPAPVVVTEETEIDYSASGPYIGIGGQYAIELFDVNGLGAGNSGGFHVEAGYRIIPNLSVEARYENYTEFDTDDFAQFEDRADPNGGHISGWSLTANAKAYLLTGRWQPYVLVGLGYLAVDPDRNSVSGDNGAFAMRFGGGMEAYITENISMGPEIAYVLPISNDDIGDLDFLTVGLGLKYIFR